MKVQKLTASGIRHLIPRRLSESQKGHNGHVLLIAGSRGMSGAAILSGLGALYSGAGLLTIGIVADERRIITARLPEAMTLPLPESKEGHINQNAGKVVKDYVRRRTITTLATGPGLGKGSAQRQMVLKLIKMQLPLVIDADGLNSLILTDLKGSQAVITPHPGELARLLAKSIREVQKDRIQIAADTARKLDVVCVLKGHETVISDGHRSFINTTGNQAMATGGMGDVLTGIIAGFLAQKLSLLDAACAGVYLHGLAGDLARISDRGLRATQVAEHVPHALKKIGIR